ncbi:hypothetical protein K3888_06265 [Dietzia aurantiaca]|uniref:hypothetical protein n=1 Tax=Dietzia aurantiaca TaxID=983873 RepID=UPI001E5EF964|nr:hypothetical protein [Dietzia aurantiaca]MCD2262305.1 hypothetical protein [Dietzia aurantiaca]
MPGTTDLREAFDAARDQFEQYRVSVSSVIEERPAGELSRALGAILPELVFYEGRAFAAELGLAQLDSGKDLEGISAVLARGLVEQQAARRSGDYLAGFADVLARVRREATH